MSLPLSAQPTAPRVYLCYADANQATADRLYGELVGRGVRTFSPQRDTLPGDQLVATIERRIGESDYFLLVWSEVCRNESWVREQWQATLHEKGAFLFVLRLDASAVPLMLAARRQFNAFEDWNTAVTELVGSWNRDRAIGYPVRPAPTRPGPSSEPTITVYIRNHGFEVSHVLAVPVAATGGRLLAQVRTELALTDEVDDFGGIYNAKLGFRFSYELLKDERSIPDLPDLPLSRMGIAEGSVIDLRITMRSFGPEGEHTPVVYRRDSDLDYPGMSPATRRSLLLKAFGHLLSGRTRA